MRWLPFLALLPSLLSAAGVSDAIAAVAQSSPVTQRAFWGAHVVDLESGQVVYSQNADKLFIPASNTKLFSTAVALMRLGPGHRFHTFVTAETAPDDQGVISGDLRLVGGGDPTLSARKYPYAKGPVRGDPLAAIDALADAVAERGVRRVTGDIVGDDSAYVMEPYPTGWAQEDASWEYGAPVGALTVHDNSFRLVIRPASESGAPALLFFTPPVEYYVTHNRVKTVSGGESRVFLEWPSGSREIHLWGTMKRGGGGQAKLLAIRDPAHYAAWVFAKALDRRGVTVEGDIRTEHQWMHEVKDFKRAPAPRPVPGHVLVDRESVPLFEILQVINKESQNLHAELVLREVGRVKRNVGSRAAGLEELKQLLTEAGVSRYAYEFEDASGLSRLNLVSPEASVKLLQYMYLSTERDGWLETLAIGGEDGTLDYRFRGDSTSGRVIAKTGTLSHASALSGYLRREDGTMLAFSIMINNYRSHASTARKFIDEVVKILLQ